MSEGRFAFATCNVGSETWLVREVARLAPGAAPSYRRKGLVTFKLAVGQALAGSVLARRHGRSLGLARDAGEVLARIEGEGPLALSVFARDASADGPDPAWVEAARTIERGLLASGRFTEGADRLLDVIVAGDEPLLVGVSARDARSRFPGGRVSVEVPEEAPSRAFAKLEEALAWSGLEVRAGEGAIELGSAPGGAAYALARRGVSVLGVDPAAMDPRVLAYRGPGGARVTHLPRKLGALRREDVPRGASLLLCDVNLAPPVALRSVTSVASWMRGSLRAAVLTLKLNDERMVDAIPALLERVAALGLSVEATQLPSNRREICVIGRRTQT